MFGKKNDPYASNMFPDQTDDQNGEQYTSNEYDLPHASYPTMPAPAESLPGLAAQSCELAGATISLAQQQQEMFSLMREDMKLLKAMLLGGFSD